MENNEIIVLIIILFIAGWIGYQEGINKCINIKNEFINLTVKYNQLNKDYNQLESRNNLLEKENNRLKLQQKNLTDDLTSYLLEQATIDILGIKKYIHIYNLVKIKICNKNPTILFC